MSTTNGTATDYLDLVDKIDAFLTAQGHAWGKAFTGVGGGDLTGYIGKAATVAQTITVTFTSATAFNVVGSVSGSLGSGTVGTLFTSTQVDFTITAGAPAYQAGDVWTFGVSPKWARLRAEGSPDAASRSSDLPSLELLFDDSTTTTERAGDSAFVQWTMRRATEVRRLVMQCAAAANAPRDFALQWRDNPGDAWTTAASWSGQTWAADEAKEFTTPTAPGAHLYWRLNITASTDTNPTPSARVIRLRNVYLYSGLTSSYSVAERFEIAWRGPGLDGSKEVHVGLKTYGSPGSDVWNVGLNGFRSWDATKAVDAQPNGSPVAGQWLSLINAPIAYWLVANGQRFVVVVRLAGTYQTAYAGFGLPYEPPSVHAYPLIVAASHVTRTMRYDSTSANFRAPVDPGSNGFAAFYPDATWRTHTNRVEGSGGDGTISSTLPAVWPARLVGDVDGVPSFIRENPDGSRPLLPVIPYAKTPTLRHVWGELEGYFWTTGFGTTAEALIREDRFDHLVVNNVFRTGVQHYAAVRLD